MMRHALKSLARRTLLRAAASGLAFGVPALRPRRGTATELSGSPKSIPYGAAVNSVALKGDDAYRAAIARYCDLVVPEGALKWDPLRPHPDRFDFSDADIIVKFAKDNRIGVRGHTLAWYAALPPWVNEVVTSRATSEHELRYHITEVVGRYRGIISSWDVVNEPIADAPGDQSLRDSIWSRYLGVDYIELAFRAARAADPAAQLYLNEFDIEYSGDRFEAKRRALLALLRVLKDKDVPIDGVGIQGHLDATFAIDPGGLGRLIGDIQKMDLKIMVTELEVIDQFLPAASRDAMAAKLVESFLTTVCGGADQPAAILSWGITDKYTWMRSLRRRPDGLPNRPLPLDATMHPKEMLAVIQRFTGEKTNRSSR
jgi:endo-1,4-beta-xylanase